MSKKIDVWTRGAVLNNCAGVYCNDNTVVRVMNDGSAIVELFGNKIFYRDSIGRVYFTLAEHNTQTTRARLNVLLSYYCNMEIYCRSKTASLRGATFDKKPLNDSIWYRARWGEAEISKVQVFD